MIVGTGLGPASSVGMPAIDTVFLRFCCHKATSTDLSHNSQVSESTLGAMVAAQTLAQPATCVHVLTKPTPAKARLFPSGRTHCLFGCPVGAEFTELAMEV